jgi:5-(carboxyamino)imidazole ribonucleotide synthase
MDKKKGYLGLIGGGQLGKMFCLSASELGFKTIVLDPQKNSPASFVATKFICADYNDKKALDKIIAKSTAISIEFENIPIETANYINKKVCFYPPPKALQICQNRILEKNFLKNNNILTADFIEINKEQDLKNITNFSYPAILKTAMFGYDGKGQKVCQNSKDVRRFFVNFNTQPCILEKKINLVKEISQVVAINKKGGKSFFPIAENIHINGILSTSKSPANITNKIADEVVAVTDKIIRLLKYQGILAIEFFINKEQELLVNEMAPRTHNSGHFSMDACLYSQFYQQVAIMANLPFGNTQLQHRVVMKNILGDEYENGKLDIQNILQKPNHILHLYGKKNPLPSRKMGHVNIIEPLK